MDNMRGMLIRGAFAMAPVKNILFNNDTIPRADDFNGSWDDLSPGTQKNWEKIAIILESVIESEIWKQASEPIVESTNTQQWWYQCPYCGYVHNTFGSRHVTVNTAHCENCHRMWSKGDNPRCLCIIHNNERYHHPQCTAFHHTIKGVGYVGGIPYKTQLFQDAWPHGTLIETYDDRCQQCKEFDNDGCPNCGPNTIKKVFDPAD
jgi:hypothetical protein